MQPRKLLTASLKTLPRKGSLTILPCLAKLNAMVWAFSLVSWPCRMVRDAGTRAAGGDGIGKGGFSFSGGGGGGGGGSNAVKWGKECHGEWQLQYKILCEVTRMCWGTTHGNTGTLSRRMKRIMPSFGNSDRSLNIRCPLSQVMPTMLVHISMSELSGKMGRQPTNLSMSLLPMTSSLLPSMQGRMDY